MTTLEQYKKLYQENKAAILDRFFTFLRFKSVSTDPEYKEEVLACADWVSKRLESMGLDVETHQTPKYPVLLAKKIIDPTFPTILLYGHYDVQPIDPIEEWVSDPFDPQVRDGAVYARGAQDNKGQCCALIEALAAVLESGNLTGCNVKVVIEGEEECGSEGFAHLIKSGKADFSADYLVVNDVTMPGADDPSVSLGARGMVALEMRVIGAATDLHSGSHGGMVHNPIRALVDILSALHDAQGRVTIPGFYDSVKELTKEQFELFNHTFDEVGYKEEFGIRATRPEGDYSLWESNWVRPSLEVNGIWGGYIGTGFKTVIPREAHAKLSCRLVPDQDPEVVEKQICDFLKSQAPKGMEIDFSSKGGGYPVLTSPDSKISQLALQAYSDVFGTPSRFTIMGGSIPIISDLSQASGAEVVFTGTGLMSDNIHAPNEHFGLDRFEKCFLTIAELIQRVNDDGRH